MRTLTIVVAALGHLLAAPALGQGEVQRERQEWVRRCLKDFEALKPGMTRAEVEKRFPIDGGLQGFSPVRYLHPDCPYFKVDVEFAVQRDPKAQNRVAPTQADKVTKVSKPYLETPFFD